MAEPSAQNLDDQADAARRTLNSLVAEFARFTDDRRVPEWSRTATRDDRVAAHGDDSVRPNQITHRKVGIAGPEGVGKSTLINAIFGQDVVPTDENQPGTAVPIEVRAVAAGLATYEIEVKGEVIACADYSEFVGYALQRNNLNNAAEVEAARVSLPSRHLPKSLCLVDLPGSDGISTRFRADALAAVDTVDAVVLVVPDRNAGPAIQLAHQIIGRGVTIDAVAINIQMSKLVDTSTMQPRAEGEIHQHISTTRDTVARHVCVELPDLKDGCQFFAFHFPSMHALSIAPDANYRSPAHNDEIVRFADWFIEHNGPHGDALRLRDVLQDVDRSLAAHRQDLLRDEDLIDGLLNSRPAAHENVSAAIVHREGVLREAWSTDVASGRIKAAMEEAWHDLEPSIAETKAQLRDLHRETKAGLPESWWSHNRQLIGQVAGDLNRAIDRIRSRLDRKAQMCLQQFGDSCREIAHGFAAAELAIAPVDLGPLALISVPTVSIWPGLQLDPQPQTLSEYDSARVMDRLLDEVAVAEMTIDTSEDGALSVAFRDAITAVAQQIESELVQRLEQLRIVVSDRQSPALAVAAQRLVGQRTVLARLEASARDARAEVEALKSDSTEQLMQRRQAMKQLRDNHVAQRNTQAPRSPSGTPSQALAVTTGSANQPNSAWQRLLTLMKSWFVRRDPD